MTDYSFNGNCHVLNFKKRGNVCGKFWQGFLSWRTSCSLVNVCALNLAYIDIVGLNLLFSILCLMITILVEFLYDITSRTVASLFSLIILYQLLPDLSFALSKECNHIIYSRNLTSHAELFFTQVNLLTSLQNYL